ncbi:MAG: OsmC family protein [Melioribacteraceae bacterium]|nr:OsmC family protein [Melioribacteraceae bacterium]MCO6474284.1 OsmC family protein [Melioribacteraceae bacterium]MDD3557919.1 OsmC family protein [Melioribacteraceae bacterium]
MAEAKAFIKQIQGITFAGKTDSNHWVTMDGPENFGGSDAGIRPKELLLLSLGGCTASDVASILQKKRVDIKGFEINISSEMTEEHPKVFTRIDLEYVFYGKGIKETDVERAIELSQTKYCGVTAMLEKVLTINHTYKIIEK